MAKQCWHLLLIFGLISTAIGQTVTADFGSHLSTTYPIPSTVMGSQYSTIMPSAPVISIYDAGFRVIRMFGMFQAVYQNNATPIWTKLDPYLDAIKSANAGKSPGLRVIMVLSYTPHWLTPTVQGCPAPGSSNGYQVPPSDVATWAKLSQGIVAHVDQKYPGLVTDYDIWNEPELGSFCVYPNTGANRLSRYVAIYAATAPLIREQASADKVTVRIGGPAIVSAGAISEFIGGLTTNSSTSPYVDFVSYHNYPSGPPDISGGMEWDKTSPDGVASLYSRIQSTSVNTGFGAEYLLVANTVKAGKQPNPTKTKIYLDEFNDNSAFSDDCCRNSTTYSPLFNGLVVLDLLDAVYHGAPRVPDLIGYYTASSPPYCLVGDTGGHCGATNYSVLYPQYYLYDMFASSSYLGLSSGGSYMAKSISPVAGTSGLAATAFWSSKQDSIVVVNPTGTPYSSVEVLANNPGFNVGHVTQYLLNSAHKSITPSTLTPKNATTPPSSSVTVSIPAYSVVAIKLAP